MVKRSFLFDDITSPPGVQVTTRQVTFPDANMVVQIATLTAMDVVNFGPPLGLGSTLAPMSPKYHFETFLDVLMLMLKPCDGRRGASKRQQGSTAVQRVTVDR